MNRHAHRPSGGDRGFALVDLVIGLALTALGAGMVAVLVASATESAAPTDQGFFDAALTVDAFTRDLDEASSLAVVGRRGPDARTVDLVGATATVRWDFAGDRLTREDPATGVVRVMLDGLDRTGRFTLLGSGGTPVDVGDPDAVRCTLLVEIHLAADDGSWTLDQAAARRIARGTTCV